MHYQWTERDASVNDCQHTSRTTARLSFTHTICIHVHTQTQFLANFLHVVWSAVGMILLSLRLTIRPTIWLRCCTKVSTTPGNTGNLLEFYNWQISMCVLLMLFSVHHLISGTVISIGLSSSSHSHLQIFHNFCSPLVILIMIDEHQNLLELC